MKLYSCTDLCEGAGYPIKAWIEKVKYFRIEGNEKYYLGWAIYIWLPSYQWGRYRDYGNTECWAQRCILIQSVDWDRGLPSPWEWHLQLWDH